SRATNYAEQRAVEKSALNCDVDYAKSAFKQTTPFYLKQNPIQPHTIIHSFKPPQLTPQQSNQLPLQLPQNIPPNHQVPLYTHPHTHHLHNHILINSIHLQTPRKYHTNKTQPEFVKKTN
ncbi:relaxase/mobilization nuclease domain-containing protein, partial [Staphylococcus epidermidis]|uniref:relaxase/mobilization nuclease domain-containing protein n=1 Tax=Staphylococcus epidermidis TaxID=1282 RepID=UPI0016424457